MTQRCEWAKSAPDYIVYHDIEWGQPIRDERQLFERISLEAFQSGLSWLTVLRKRDAFRRAFNDFDPVVVAHFDEKKIEQLLDDASIIRHRAKIEACINNARVLNEQHALHGPTWLVSTLAAAAPTEASLRAQGFRRPAMSVTDLPSATEETQRLAQDLKAVGMRFLGPTTLYAALQAAGFVHDHVLGCHLYAENR